MLSWTTLRHLVLICLAIASQFATITSGARCVHEEPFELAPCFVPSFHNLLQSAWEPDAAFLACLCFVLIKE